MFELHDRETVPERELRILRFWEEEGIPHASLKKGEPSKTFSFYDGPPFATGLPHYGHILAGTIKDVVPRFWSMLGYRVPRRFGWDCHGLPVENEIEKGHELSGAHEIEQFGIGRFNEECRKIVLRYTEEWRSTVSRMGRWVDFDHTYHTMDKTFMESVWWVFGELYRKGLIYEGLKVMPFSAKLGTPLSNFEANLNYRDVDDPSLVVKFALERDPEVSLLAWTTTPWTLPSNLALAVSPHLDYVKIRDHASGQLFILAQARVDAHFTSYDIVEVFRGTALSGLNYRPVFPYFSDTERAFQILVDEFVTLDEGTGIVHLAPAFGEADFFACQKASIEPVCPIDQNGRFDAQVPDYAGMFVKDADKEIIRRLKKEGRVLSHTQIRHRYPFCWRSDTPLIYKAVKTWFVAVESLKERLLEANRQIHWVPDHLQEGRFGQWLKNARDWAISRNRYWGTPIPLWRSDTGKIMVISSVKELEEKTGVQLTDLHRHKIDDLVIHQDGETFRRIPEVFDCWFESGSMPYAQHHFPFENRDETLQAFPADFIGEGIDQTRGWFYTLHVLAVALFDRPAFKNVIVNGIILAEDGTKMSKRLKNYPEPSHIMGRFGADALRYYLLSSPAVMAEDLRFSAQGVEQVLRQVILPLWNSYLFLATYSNIYAFQPGTRHDIAPHHILDRWILSELQTLIHGVTRAFTAYELQQAVLPIGKFVDQLTDWYIRRSRNRFWADEATQGRQEAFETLYRVLHTLSCVIAPVLPFLSEAIYQGLRTQHDPRSVHLCDFPKGCTVWENKLLEEEMALTQQVVSLGHSARKEHHVKVRQPLSVAHIIAHDPRHLEILQRCEGLIMDELNVKRLEFHHEAAHLVTLTAKPNFRVLGKKVGQRMPQVQACIADLPFSALSQLQRGKSITVVVGGEDVVVTRDDVCLEYRVSEGLIAATSETCTVVFDGHVSHDLMLEGIARELVNKINTVRKEMGFSVTDRVLIEMTTSDEVKEAFHRHHAYICHETLTIAFEFVKGEEAKTVDINGHPTSLSLKKR